jgi:hypothetical protein
MRRVEQQDLRDVHPRVWDLEGEPALTRASAAGRGRSARRPGPRRPWRRSWSTSTRPSWSARTSDSAQSSSRPASTSSRFRVWWPATRLCSWPSEYVTTTSRSALPKTPSRRDPASPANLPRGASRSRPSPANAPTGVCGPTGPAKPPAGLRPRVVHLGAHQQPDVVARDAAAQERIDGALGVGDGVVCPAECVHGGGRAGTAAFRRGHWIGGCAHKCLLSQGLTASVTPPSLLVWFARRAREDPGLLPCRITARLSGPGAPGLTTRVACHESARRWRRRGRGDALPERERVRLGAGREERDLQRPLAHRVVLAHELVHAAVAEHAIPVFVDVDAV